MTIRGIAWVVILVLAGILSAGVTVTGIWSALGLDFAQDTVLSIVYCAMPMLCFPVFLLMRSRSQSGILLSLMALTYLGAYSTLNWRTCSELGYCMSMLGTVMETLSTNVVLAFFGVVILTLMSQLVDDRSSLWIRSR
jgi:hypothetical protein